MTVTLAKPLARSSFSPQQNEAMAKFAAWKRIKHSPFFYLAGYAGTGKTTIAKHLASMEDGRVKYAAFTGKAAQVMKENGCVGASTIHSLIYDASLDTKTGKWVYQLTSARLEGVSLIVIDECSMVNEQIGRDLLSFGIPILALGDPAQLPPVEGSGYFTSKEPDYMLTEIHRQAADNPIIRLATAIRENRTPRQEFDNPRYPGARILFRDRFNERELLAFDTVIVGTNRNRLAKNRAIRELKRYPDLRPVQGDILVCMRNNSEKAVFNGVTYMVTSKPKGVSTRFGKGFTMKLENDQHITVPTQWLLGEASDTFAGGEDVDRFEFGYAITAHKSQGSQWSNVCVYDESFIFREHGAKWLYTAVTRATDTVTLLINRKKE